jgi:hypothetical protein
MLERHLQGVNQIKLIERFYVYLNVTFAGEILGSAEEKDITLRIDDADLAPRHASIRLEVDEETNRICYVLRDLKSGHRN